MALCLVSGVIIMPVVISMTLSKGALGEISVKMVDTFISIFLAVLWFNFFHTAVHVSGIRHAFPFAEQIVGLVFLGTLYSTALGVAYYFRESEVTLPVFCGMGAHFIAFAGIQACGSTQAYVATETGDLVGPFSSLGVVLGVLAVFVGISLAVKFGLMDRLDEKADDFKEAIDELELDICGLVLSFIITQSVRHVITGEYPPLGHLFIQADSGDHTILQRRIMLGWSVLLTIVAAFAVPRLEEFNIPAKAVHGLKTVFIMCIAWGYLLWGQWLFADNFTGDVMFGYQVFACIVTLVCMLFVIILTRYTFVTKAARETKAITMTGVSLAAAWSWEHCFNTAFNIIGDEYQVGFGGLVPKGVLAVVLPCFLMPLYLHHVKPRVFEIEEEEEKEAERAAQEAERTSERREMAGGQ